MLYSGIHSPRPDGSITSFILLLLFFFVFVGMLVFSIYDGDRSFIILFSVLIAATFFTLAGQAFIMYRRKAPPGAGLLFSDEDTENLGFSDSSRARGDSVVEDIYDSSCWASGDPFTPDSVSIEN